MNKYICKGLGGEGVSAAWDEILPNGLWLKRFEIVVDTNCSLGVNRDKDDNAYLIPLLAGDGFKMEMAAVYSVRILESGVAYRWCGEGLGVI